MLLPIPSQRPAATACFEYPSCIAWIMSVFAKTAHRVAITGALSLKDSASMASSSTVYPRRAACCSMKAPVPEAQGGFTECSTYSPRSSKRIRENVSPPIANIFFDPGARKVPPSIRQRVLFITIPPLPGTFPVIPAESKEEKRGSSKTAETASMKFPPWGR